MGLYQYDSIEDKLKLVAGSTNFSDAPVGAIFPFGGTDIPVSFLLCDGSAVSRTDYEDLFNVIGTAFGTGDGSTTFNIPDLRESVPKGAGETGQTVGAHVKSGGLAVGEFLDDRVQEHKHEINADNSPKMHSASYGTNGGNTSVATESAILSNPAYANTITSGRHGVTTEVKSVGVNYIIKAKMVALPADLASAVADAVDEAVDEALADTGWVTVSSYVKARRVGKIVSLVLIYDKSVINAGNWTKVADLDARFYPSKQTIGCSYYLSGGTIYHTDYFIAPTGAVNLLGNMDLETTAIYIAD